MTKFARGSIIVSIAAAACEVALAWSILPAWSPSGPQFPQLAFLAGPLLFLAILAWRRRQHVSRSRFLFLLALFASTGGLAVLGIDVLRFHIEPVNQRSTHSHPLIVPLFQWVSVVATWLILVFQEGREKQAANKTA
jgi:hypothetical protein